MRRLILTLITAAALLPLVAACQKTYDERPAADEVAAPSCDCEEKCPDCACEKGGKKTAPCGESEGRCKGKGTGCGGKGRSAEESG